MQSVVLTVAGTGDPTSLSGDGGLAQFGSLTGPGAVAVDKSGNLYISDMAASTVRGVSTSTASIFTVAGTGVAGSLGDGGAATAAQLNFPSGIAVDVSGDVYIEDMRNNRVRIVSKSTGAISTFAGGGTSVANGIPGIAATSAALRCAPSPLWAPNPRFFLPCPTTPIPLALTP